MSRYRRQEVSGFVLDQSTYANLDASMRWWWDNTSIPLEDSFADDIETQLFPAFGLNNTDWRIVWDRSQVPALREDEQAKHSMICADFKAGIIDRDEARVGLGYESKPEYRGQFAVEAKAAEAGGADDAIKAREYHRGKTKPGTNSGSFAPGGGAHIDRSDRMISIEGTNEIPGKSGNKEREKINWQHESLDTMHEWHGDALPDGLRPLEREEFTDSLAKAVRYLEVNTKEGYNEAGVAISVSDSRWCSEIAEGTLGKVDVPEPPTIDGTVAPFSRLHTHRSDEGPSPKDWANFLSNKPYVQMCIVTPSFTLMLYKPPHWITTAEHKHEKVLQKTMDM